MSDGQIKSYFDRWQRLEEAKAEISEDLKELFAEAKSCGFDTKAMRVAFRCKVKDDERTPDDEAFDAVVETYRAAIDAPRAHPAPAHEKTLKNFQSAEALDAPQSAPAGAASDKAPATHSQAKASVDNGATGPGIEVPADSVTGDASRPSRGGGTPASNSEPDGGAIGGVKAQGRLPDAAGVEPSPSEPIRKSSLRPLCRHPDDGQCRGYGSVTCHSCLKAARESEAA